MRNIVTTILISLFLLILTCPAYAVADTAGSKDYPGLGRMPGYHISGYCEMDDGSYVFISHGNKRYFVEGHKYVIEYKTKKRETHTVGFYDKIVKKRNGTVLLKHHFDMTAVINMNGKQVWFFLLADNAFPQYTITVIESDIMYDLSTMPSNASLDSPESVSGYTDFTGLERMSGFYMSAYCEMNPCSYNFPLDSERLNEVKGHKFVIEYRNEKPLGHDAITGHYTSVVKKHGGKIVMTKLRHLTGTYKIGDIEVWVYLDVLHNGGQYSLTIVKTEPEKDDENCPLKQLKKNGSVTFPNIKFTSGTDKLLPCSDAEISKIAKMLKNHQDLKIYLIGHVVMTDDNIASQINLSVKRAQAVMKVLHKKHGIAVQRVVARGVGPLCPVTSPDTAEGKKLNERIVIIEM